MSLYECVWRYICMYMKAYGWIWANMAVYECL